MRLVARCLAILLVLLLPLSGGAAAKSDPPPQTGAAPVYIIDKQDRIKIIVYGEDELSGDFTVDTTGSVSLPLVGQLTIGGMGVREVEEAIAAKLRQGYLREPRVNVQVLTYRPFYILGEVTKPGAYPFADGMRVNNAVAVGGGFTYRADQKDIVITRTTKDGQKTEFPAGLDTFILPGDVIKVDERFF